MYVLTNTTNIKMCSVCSITNICFCVVLDPSTCELLFSPDNLFGVTPMTDMILAESVFNGKANNSKLN